MTQEPAVRCDVVFEGRVQGVGFRHATNVVATRYYVSGYVANKRDGTVHMVAEGAREDVSRMIQEILRTMAGCATSHRATWSEAMGEFPDFRVRRDEP